MKSPHTKLILLFSLFALLMSVTFVPQAAHAQEENITDAQRFLMLQIKLNIYVATEDNPRTADTLRELKDLENKLSINSNLTGKTVGDLVKIYNIAAEVGRTADGLKGSSDAKVRSQASLVKAKSLSVQIAVIVLLLEKGAMKNYKLPDPDESYPPFIPKDPKELEDFRG